MRFSHIIVTIFFFSLQLSAQIDKEFWFAAPDLTQGTQGEINGNSYRDRPIQVVLSTLVKPTIDFVMPETEPVKVGEFIGA